MKICNPAKLYIGISILFLLIGFLSKSISVYALLLKSFFVLLWVYVLSILCKKGMKELAWAFVLLPFVAMGSTLIYRGGHREGLTVNDILGDWRKTCINPTINNRVTTNGKVVDSDFAASCINPSNPSGGYKPSSVRVNACIANAVINDGGILTCKQRKFV